MQNNTNLSCKDVLSTVDAFFFDLDGCIYHTDQLASGANELLELLRQSGKKVGFITNNSRETGVEIAKKLKNMGLSVTPGQIVTATEMTGAYLKEKYGSLNVTVVGSEALGQSLERWGHHVLALEGAEKVDAVVVGRDTEFTFDKLHLVAELEGKGARVVSTNPDMYHPGKGGVRVPETGALIAAIEAIIQKSVEYVGKPDPYLFQFGMNLFEAAPSKSVMVGDNLETDIKGGIQAGMHTIWIRGAGMGQSLDDLEERTQKPDVTINQLDELLVDFQEYVMMTK